MIQTTNKSTIRPLNCHYSISGRLHLYTVGHLEIYLRNHEFEPYTLVIEARETSSVLVLNEINKALLHADTKLCNFVVFYLVSLNEWDLLLTLKIVYRYCTYILYTF